MAPKKILVLVGDYVEDYEVMVPFQTLLIVLPSAKIVLSRDGRYEEEKTL